MCVPNGPDTQSSRSRQLIDHLIGAHEYRIGNLDAERLSGFHVNYQVELCRLLDRKVGGFRAFEDFIHQDGGVASMSARFAP